MNLRNSTYRTTDVNVFKELDFIAAARQLPHYLVCAILGIIAGGLGVALVIGLVIGVKLLLSPMVIFSPSVIILAAVAAGFGIGIAWMLSQMLTRIVRNTVDNADKHGLQVTLIFSILTGLLQTLLFMTGM